MVFEHGACAILAQASPTDCVVCKRVTAVFYFTYDAKEISKMKVNGAFNCACTELSPKAYGTCATEASD